MMPKVVRISSTACLTGIYRQISGATVFPASRAGNAEPGGQRRTGLVIVARIACFSRPVKRGPAMGTKAEQNVFGSHCFLALPLKPRSDLLGSHSILSGWFQRL